jgi:hypothetical protein
MPMPSSLLDAHAGDFGSLAVLGEPFTSGTPSRSPDCAQVCGRAVVEASFARLQQFLGACFRTASGPDVAPISSAAFRVGRAQQSTMQPS